MESKTITSISSNMPSLSRPPPLAHCKTFKSNYISPSQSPDSAHVNVTSNPSTPDKKEFEEFDQNRRDSGVSDVSNKVPIVEFRRHSDLPTINKNQQFLNEVRRGSDTNTLANWKIPDNRNLAMDIKNAMEKACRPLPNNEILSTTNSKLKDREVIYPVSCGDLQGHLYFTRFLCPGINANCILHEGEWITPKTLVSKAGKTALKDWKRALRINGQMLRKLIDSKELDYYKHDEHCSNSCRSNKGEYLAIPSFKSNSFDTASFYQQHLNKDYSPLLSRANSDSLSYEVGNVCRKGNGFNTSVPSLVSGTDEHITNLLSRRASYIDTIRQKEFSTLTKPLFSGNISKLEKTEIAQDFNELIEKELLANSKCIGAPDLENTAKKWNSFKQQASKDTLINMKKLIETRIKYLLGELFGEREISEGSALALSNMSISCKYFLALIFLRLISIDWS